MMGGALSSGSRMCVGWGLESVMGHTKSRKKSSPVRHKVRQLAVATDPRVTADAPGHGLATCQCPWPVSADAKPKAWARRSSVDLRGSSRSSVD